MSIPHREEACPEIVDAELSAARENIETSEVLAATARSLMLNADALIERMRVEDLADDEIESICFVARHVSRTLDKRCASRLPLWHLNGAGQ